MRGDGVGPGARMVPVFGVWRMPAPGALLRVEDFVPWARQELASVAGRAPEGLLVLDGDTRVSAADPGAADVLGIAPLSLLRAQAAVLVPGLARKAWEDGLSHQGLAEALDLGDLGLVVFAVVEAEGWRGVGLWREVIDAGCEESGVVEAGVVESGVVEAGVVGGASSPDGGLVASGVAGDWHLVLAGCRTIVELERGLAGLGVGRGGVWRRVGGEFVLGAVWPVGGRLVGSPRFGLEESRTGRTGVASMEGLGEDWLWEGAEVWPVVAGGMVVAVLAGAGLGELAGVAGAHWARFV